MRVGRFVLQALAWWVFIVLAGCADSGSSPAGDRAVASLTAPAEERFNLLLVSIDTLRADHLGAYGYRGVETPNIDRLASEGVLFDRAASPVPLTLPSHASLLTGQYPFTHGVRDNLNFQLDESAVSLAEVLEQAGYATGGFVGAFVLDSGTGIAQGFGEFTDFSAVSAETASSRDQITRRADAVVQDALQWIRAQDDLFFAWVHLFDPHLPYDPPVPFDAQYPDRPYDGEIAYTDRTIGTLLDGLEARGLAGNTLLVVTADHGEGLGDHSEQRHGFLVYDSTIRVPLILWAPRLLPAGVVVAAQTSLVDLLPTVLGILAIDDPAHEVRDGVDLRGMIADPSHPGRSAYSESMAPLFSYGWAPLRALTSGGYKHVAGLEPELYDLGQDPGEEKNLAAALPGRVTTMQEELEALIADDQPGRTMSGSEGASPEQLDRLRSLGYVGASSSATTNQPADAESLIRTVESFEDGIEDVVWNLGIGDTSAATALLEELDALVPDHHTVYYYRGRTALLAGDTRGALDSLQRSLALQPAYSLTHLELARAHWAAGDTPAAFGVLSDAIERFPSAATFKTLLGTYYYEAGRQDDALRLYLAAREQAPREPTLLSNLALLHIVRGEQDEALELLNLLVEVTPEDPEAWNHLGYLHGSIGGFADAEEAFRRSLDLDENQAGIRYSLGIMLVYEAAEAFDMAARLDPTSEARARLEELIRSGILRQR